MKKKTTGLAPNYIALSFETDPEHRLDKKYTKDLFFPIYLSLHALAEVYTLWVLLFKTAFHISATPTMISTIISVCNKS